MDAEIYIFRRGCYNGFQTIRLGGCDSVQEQRDMYRLEGSVEAIIFRNEDNGYTVLQMATDSELLTVVGEFAGVAVGETLVVTGYYATHPRFGTQFHAEVYERLMPATAAAIETYLASGAVKGVGGVLARRLVKKFGEETLSVMEQTPARLCEVEGISPKKAEKIAEEYNKLFGMRSVMLYLSGCGIPAPFAIKVWKQFGLAAQEIIAHNPYALCIEEIGVDFERADNIALHNGVAVDAYERLAAGVVHVLRHNLGNGHVCLPEDKLAVTGAKLVDSDSHHILDAIADMEQRGEVVALVREGQRYLYLPRYYQAECAVAARISKQLDQRENGLLVPDVEGFVDEYGQKQGISYADLQRKAIVTAITHPMMILTGGPGTGKTTAISAIIRLLGQVGEKVALAAPTGRAAKRMSELTDAEAKTVHRLLEVDFGSDQGETKFKRNEKNPLPCDTVIIDEASMLDVLLFESLLRALRPGCRLILVGDPDQLPPVGAGNVLGDLIECGLVPMVHLSEIFRQAAQSLIVTNAHAIVSGQYPQMDLKDNDFFFLASSNPGQISATTADLCARRLPKSYHFSPMWDIQVLAPTRVGALGTTELNRVLQKALNPPSPTKKEYSSGLTLFREGDKVMQIRNNYDLVWERDSGEEGMGVFNGDIGVIEMINKPSASILVRFDDHISEYAFDMANELELAYAITVHKSQGNEYDAVVLPLAEGRGRMYYRNLLYTAVTRAKKLLIIVGSRNAVQFMVDNHKKSRRYTNLVHLLGELRNG